MSKRIVVAVTGASGAPYAQRFLEVLAAQGCDVHVVLSPYGRRLFLDEMAIENPTPDSLVGPELAGQLTLHPYRDVGDSLASGSFLTDGMVICPCSNNTLGEVAAGLGGNLVSRAAAVHLKEARRLILLTREMPASPIDLENMLRISRAGGVICPASPGFYLRPKTIDELVDFVVGKLCDLLGVDHDLSTRWDPNMSVVSKNDNKDC